MKRKKRKENFVAKLSNFLSMFSNRKSISISSNLHNSWKIRSINGFEKYLFPNTQLAPKRQQRIQIDPARFIYPRDAMGDLLHRKATNITPFYFPNYSLVESRSPIWTIKNVYPSRRVSQPIDRWRCKR